MKTFVVLVSQNILVLVQMFDKERLIVGENEKRNICFNHFRVLFSLLDVTSFMWDIWCSKGEKWDLTMIEMKMVLLDKINMCCLIKYKKLYLCPYFLEFLVFMGEWSNSLKVTLLLAKTHVHVLHALYWLKIFASSCDF